MRNAALQGVIFGRGDIFHYGFNSAVENAAQIVDGGGIQRFVFSELVYGWAGNAIILYKGVGGFSWIFESFPKRSINNHSITLPQSLITSYVVFTLLTMLVKKDYNNRGRGSHGFWNKIWNKVLDSCGWITGNSCMCLGVTSSMCVMSFSDERKFRR